MVTDVGIEGRSPQVVAVRGWWWSGPGPGGQL
jgi:hypothetical protein